jgi:CO dehydrogenase maturation factor
VRGVIGQLGTRGNGSGEGRDITVVDMEASIEHLSRGTLRHVDTLLIVTEPYYRALETAGRTVRHARALNIPHIYAVANKVRSPQDEQAIRDYCAAQDLAVAGIVPFDEQVTEADRDGRALLDVAPDSAAVRAIAQLTERVAGATS